MQPIGSMTAGRRSSAGMMRFIGVAVDGTAYISLSDSFVGEIIAIATSDKIVLMGGFKGSFNFYSSYKHVFKKG